MCVWAKRTDEETRKHERMNKSEKEVWKASGEVWRVSKDNGEVWRVRTAWKYGG